MWHFSHITLDLSLYSITLSLSILSPQRPMCNVISLYIQNWSQFFTLSFLISSSISFISSILYLYHILDRSLFIEFWISILYKVFTKNCLNSKKAKILFFCSIYFFIFLARHILLYLSYGKIFYSTIFYFLIW